jgi:hypothetical protein
MLLLMRMWLITSLLLLLLLDFDLGSAFQLSDSNVYKKCANRDVLVVGDGDLSFSRCLATLGNFKSLTVSTLDTYEQLYHLQ